MEEWSNRPLDSVYGAVFIDAIVVKVREGQVTNRPVYAVIGVTLEGRKDVLGLTMGTGGDEGAKFVDERARRTGEVSQASVPPAAGLLLLDELLPTPTQRFQADRDHLSTCAVHPF